MSQYLGKYHDDDIDDLNDDDEPTERQILFVYRSLVVFKYVEGLSIERLFFGIKYSE